MKKSLKLLLSLLILLGGIVIISLFKQKTPIEFKHLILETTTSAAGCSVYELELKDDGIFVEYSYKNSYWENDLEKESKVIFHQDILPLETAEKINQVLNTNKVSKWDGWHKTNSNVLDGGGFCFELETTDGQSINCSGTNTSPNNYGEVAEMIISLCTKKVLVDSEFTTDAYTINLPDKWLNRVTVRYGDGIVSFGLKAGDYDCSIFNIYQNNYGFYEGDKYFSLKEEIGEDKKVYIFCCKGDSIDSYKTKMSIENQAIIETLDEDMQTIIESFK